VSEMNRRDLVKILAAVPIAGRLAWSPPEVEAAWLKAQALRRAGKTGADYTPMFFTPHEWETVRILVDLILPADERSGSATDAGVPEFMDFIIEDNEGMQVPIRGGLAWLDTECRQRFGESFVGCSGDERAAVLDLVAWPERAKPEHSQGVAFFNRFRDLTASGFFSSRMGVEDLQYMGNRAIREWTGCPPEVLDRLGVDYRQWDAHYGGGEDGSEGHGPDHDDEHGREHGEHGGGHG
jgi:gluconate 2-dehydrogenase gamma chain